MNICAGLPLKIGGVGHSRAVRGHATSRAGLRARRQIVGLTCLRIRNSAIFLCLLVVFSTEGHTQFDYSSNGSWITITGYTGPGGEVVIPDTIEGLPVRVIQGSLSQENDTVTRVVIPEGVRTVGDAAFASYSALDEVVIPQSVTSLGDSGFRGCIKLSRIVLPEGLISLGNWAFCGCSEIKAVAIPDGTRSLGYGAFYGCSNLAGIRIPASVLGIWELEHTFAYCGSLAVIDVDPSNPHFQSVDGVVFDRGMFRLIAFPGGRVGSYAIPKSIGSVSGGAFLGCANLTSISIPASTTNIWSGTFDGCSGLMEITVDEANPTVRSVDGVLFSRDGDMIATFPAGRTGTYCIPEGVVSIAHAAFFRCAGLTSVFVPDGVREIGSGSFYGCRSLAGIYFGGTPPSALWDFNTEAETTTAYYLPGVPDWGPTLGGVPTRIWRPRILMNNSSLGMQPERMDFDIEWAGERAVVVEAAGNPAGPDWTPLETITLSDGQGHFDDPAAADAPKRFYRLNAP